MRKQIFALAIFAVLLVAAGGVVSMAQDSSTYAPTAPSEGVNIFSTAGPFCISVDGYVNQYRFYIMQIGPAEWLLGGQDIGVSYPCPIDGSMYYDGGLYYIGLVSFPVADPSFYAGSCMRGIINPATMSGYVAWNNPMWGTCGETTWRLVSPCSSVATSGEDMNAG